MTTTTKFLSTLTLPIVLFAGVPAVAPIACSPAKEAAIVRAAGDIGACIILHEGDANEQIESECGATPDDIQKILLAKRAKLAMQFPKCVGASSSTSPSSSSSAP